MSLVRSSRSGLPRAAVMLLVASAVGLGGCASRRQTAEPAATGSIERSGLATSATAQDWANRYAANPNSKPVILGYAQALRQNGQTVQSVAVLREAMLKMPKDFDVASAYGKALAANGDFDAALKVIREGNSQTRPDWRLLAAEGAILDQTNRPQEARRLYDTALRIAPGEPSILNNYGLSYLLTKELPQAEAMLRRAAESPRADSRVRQNLALALGLQGRFEDAERVARNELSPDQAEANMTYLRSMLQGAGVQRTEAGGAKRG